MRWLPLIALALLVGIAVGAPYGVGALTESGFRSMVRDLEGEGRDWRLTGLDYERGYLNAVARYELRWRMDNGEEQVLPLVTRFSHGLTDVRAMTRLPDETLESIASLMPEGMEPRLRVEVGIGGSADLRLRIPGLDWGPDTTVPALAGSGGKVAPVDLHGEWSPGNEHRLTMEWPGLSMDLGDARIEVSSVTLDHRLSPLGERLWQGQSQLDVASLTVDPVLDDPIIADKVRFRFHSGTQKGYLDANLEAVISELRNAGRSFGRQALLLKAERLHAGTLDNVVDSFMALRAAEAAAGGGNAERGQDLMDRYERLSENLQTLSARGGRLSLEEVLLTLPDGTVEGEGFIEYPRLPASEWDQPVSLIRHASAEGVLNVDRGMVWALPRVARRVLARLERENVVTPRDGRYHLDLRLESMQLRVNDDRFEVPPLL
ncbi:DUF945 family protein [Vreelandella utahensis]|uniref:DUF945 family protein n=1 Tax=Vreelandella halophila TaxID=86177 RepID=UPI00098635E1|nr:DUF945 family protein [Halomonas utahensis]